MYTNRGFLQRTYGQTQSPKKKYELRLPKLSKYPNPPMNYSPSVYSTDNIRKVVKDFASLSPSAKKSSNIFLSPDARIENTRSYGNLNTDYYYSKNPNTTVETFSSKSSHLIDSIFEIHGTGYAYTSKLGYGSCLGMGFLITKSLAITANSVMPDIDIASRCFARFTDNAYESHSFDSNLFFYTNKDLNFTVIGFSPNPDGKKSKVPLEFKEEFVLKTGDIIAYFNCGGIGRNVTGVDIQMFYYTAGSYISPGTPLFTSDWRLQGLHHTCTASYRFNQATRIDVIINCIKSVKAISTNPELDLLLTGYNNTKIEENTFDGNGYLYWIEWYNRNIYRYDISSQRWNKVQINNLSQFIITEKSDWSFNWGSRIVYVNKKIFIIGGVGHELSNTKSDVYEFIPDTKELFRKKEMQERREGPATIVRCNYIYVMGGKYSYNTCEKYSIDENNWVNIAPMNYGRYEPVAVLLQNDRCIYVVGGFPQDKTGRSIERYDILNDRWELVCLSLPWPVIHPGVFGLSNKKFVLIGGKYSKTVVMIEVLEGIQNKPLESTNELIKLYEVDNLVDSLETVYPAILNKEDDKLYLMKSQEGVSPQIFSYDTKNFIIRSNNDVNYDYKRTIKLPPLTSRLSPDPGQ